MSTVRPTGDPPGLVESPGDASKPRAQAALLRHGRVIGRARGSDWERRIRTHRLRFFAGRRGELATVRSTLRRSGEDPVLFCVCGPGGIGKSTLLQRVAYEAE